MQGNQGDLSVKFFVSLFLSSEILLFFAPEPVPRPSDKYVFQARLRDGNCINLPRKCLDQIGDEPVRVVFFNAYLPADHANVNIKARVNTHGERFRFAHFQDNHISADFFFQVGGGAEGNQFSFIQNRQAIAAISLFHEVSGHEHRHLFFIAQNAEVLPYVAACSRVKPGRRFVQ